MATVVTLISSDERKIEVPIEASKLSTLVVNTLNLDEDTIPDGPLEMPVMKVDGETLETIVKFLVYYAVKPLVIEEEEVGTLFIKEKFEDNISDPFYLEYMNAIGADLDNIYKLKDAANYMEIQSLLQLICLWMVAELEKCKCTDDCLKLLRIPEFANEEEEHKYRLETAWMFRFKPEPQADTTAAAVTDDASSN